MHFERTVLTGITSLFFVSSACCLTACDNKPSQPEAVHACELVPASEVESLIGATVDKPPMETHRVNKEHGYWMSMCVYYAPDENLSLSVMYRPFPQPEMSPVEVYESNIKELKAQLPDYPTDPIEGIGEKAFWSAPTGQLTIVSKRHVLLVSGPGEDKLDSAKKLGKLALSKLDEK